MADVLIQLSDLERSDVIELLSAHLMEASQQQASHAFTVEKLRAPDVCFFEARNNKDELMGVAGLKILSDAHAEIKSVRTHSEHLRKGVSTRLMKHITEFAKKKGINRLCLETHPTPAYAAARALYERLGYEYCEPFGDYRDIESSVFMSKQI